MKGRIKVVYLLWDIRAEATRWENDVRIRDQTRLVQHCIQETPLLPLCNEKPAFPLAVNLQLPIRRIIVVVPLVVGIHRDIIFVNFSIFVAVEMEDESGREREEEVDERQGKREGIRRQGWKRERLLPK